MGRGMTSERINQSDGEGDECTRAVKERKKVAETRT
jgi:hypothetical protein